MTLHPCVRRGFVGIAAIWPFAFQSANAQTLDSIFIASFRWRNVGPANFGGRVADIAGIPSPSKTLYVATATGGIWKSTNAGTTFQPVFDAERVISMGAIAIAPSDTNVVWAGTGEQNSRNSIEPGGGVFKSVDGGRHWQSVGLEHSQHVGRIVIDPANPNVVYVAALGSAWSAGGQRGLYKTSDGGKTWRLAKSVDDSTGFVDVVMDPSHPATLFAASYQRIRGPYFLKSGGKGSALWKTMDAGETWREVKGGGFPSTTKGRIGIAIAKANPDVVYALVEADTAPNPHPLPSSPAKSPSGLYRSTDGGMNWVRTNDQDSRPFYYSQVRVDPRNPDRIYWSSTPLLFSDDGGVTARPAALGVHVDHHAMWIDPHDPEHFVVGNDGGVAQTWDRGGSYQEAAILPTGQFYAVSYDFAVPYNVCGGAQDNGSWCGPSRSRNNPVTNASWFNFLPGDGFWTAQDPEDPFTVYGESQNGHIAQYNVTTGETRTFLQPSGTKQYQAAEDSIAVIELDSVVSHQRANAARIAQLRTQQRADSSARALRYNWETPFVQSSHNRSTFYVGANRVLRSIDRGEHLDPISPDLTRQERDKIEMSTMRTGGITADLSGAETYGTIVALAESPVKPGVLYAGTDDGNLWATGRDAAWLQIDSKLFEGLPSGGAYVSRIEPSYADTLIWYVAFDNHRTGDFAPYVYITQDGGKHFRSIASDLPRDGPAYVHVIREDPHNPNLLFVGTSVGVWASTDRGVHWSRFSSGMPTVPVYDLRVHPRERELIAATHGRNFFIVDIAALEQAAGAPLPDVKLFTPTRAFQYPPGSTYGGNPNAGGQHVYRAASPGYGAAIDYWVAPSAAPGGTLKLRIQDVSGDTIATLSGPGTPGLHHLLWNYTARRIEPVVRTPSQLRDSIRRDRRIALSLDSLSRTGWPPAMVDSGRAWLRGELRVDDNFVLSMSGGQLTFTMGAGGLTTSATAPVGGERPAEGSETATIVNRNPRPLPSSERSFDALRRLVDPPVQRVLAAGNTMLIHSVQDRGERLFDAGPGQYRVSIDFGAVRQSSVLEVQRAPATLSPRP